MRSPGLISAVVGEALISSSAVVSHKRGVAIISTTGQDQCAEVAADLLYRVCRDDTVLFLSGGTTPSGLYSRLATEERLVVGAAAMVDERFGKPMHERSNELMIGRSQLLGYLTGRQIPFTRILGANRDLAGAASAYEERFRDLLSRFPVSVAILGVGADGHVAGILPDRPGHANPVFSPADRDRLVSYSIGSPDATLSQAGASEWHGPRVTLTVRALTSISTLIVIAFGDRKRQALSQLFTDGAVEDLPARFLAGKAVAPKTVLITDQRI